MSAYLPPSVGAATVTTKPSRRSEFATVIRIPQPPSQPVPQQPRSAFRSFSSSSNAGDSNMDVEQLRRQVHSLSAELRQLRTDLSGSMQHLPTNSHSSSSLSLTGTGCYAVGTATTFASVRRPAETSRHPSVGVTAVMMEQARKPPLPPRMYRPAKPRRTFAHGSSTLLDADESLEFEFRANDSIDSQVSARCQPPPLPPPRIQTTPGRVRNPPPPPPTSTTTTIDSIDNQKCGRPSADASVLFSSQPPPPPFALSNGHLGQRHGSFTCCPTSGRGSLIQTNGSIGTGSTIGCASSPNGKRSSPNVGDRCSLLQTRHSGSVDCLVGKGAAERMRQLVRGFNAKTVNLDLIDNLTQFHGDPLTDENLARTLRNAFQKGVCWYEIGPVLLFINPYNDLASPLTLGNVKDAPAPLVKLAKDIHGRFYECETSQAVVFDGERGSGKTYLSMQLTKQLFRHFYGARSSENDPYKQFSACVQVLRSMTSVKAENALNYSSRAAFLYELHVADGNLYKAKAYCSFSDYQRLTKLPHNESNFQIFYQLLIGLNDEEKKKFHLSGHGKNSLNYLKHRRTSFDLIEGQHSQIDRALFAQFKACLSTLGIPFSDIMRILAAILLLGNVRFSEAVEGSSELSIEGSKELDAAAALLGVTSLALYKGLATRQLLDGGQSVKVTSSAHTASLARDTLATALYHRCTSAIVRRANTLKPNCGLNGANSTCQRPSSGISSSDESSVHDSGIGMASSSPNVVNNGRPVCNGNNLSSQNSSHGPDGLINILDCLGFDSTQNNNFEQLCANFAAEKTQQFYMTNIFCRNEQLLKMEGIQSDFDWQPSPDAWMGLIDLFQSPSTGIFQALCDQSTLSESYQKLQDVARHNKLMEMSVSIDEENCKFIVRHYGDVSVNYQLASDSVPVKRHETLTDDIIRIFGSQACNFGFVSYLFSADTKMLENKAEQKLKLCKGDSATHSDIVDKARPSFAQEFILQLDSFLASVNHSKAHFVRTIRPNNKCEYFYFESSDVARQCKRLAVLPTVHMLNAGLPYVMKLKEFNNRYRFLALKYHNLLVLKQAPSPAEEARVIVDCYLRAVDESNLPYVSNRWSIGTTHIFLSDGARRQLELLRSQHRCQAASVIQQNVRRWLRKQHQNVSIKQTPTPPPSFALQRTPMNSVQSGPDESETRTLCTDQLSPSLPLSPRSQSSFHMPTSVVPALPPSRSYTIHSDKKVNFPQRRVIAQSYTDPTTGRMFRENEIVTALGWSTSSNHLLIRDSLSMEPKTVSIPATCTKISLPA